MTCPSDRITWILKTEHSKERGIICLRFYQKHRELRVILSTIRILGKHDAEDGVP